MTAKIYYEDPHIGTFDATVLSCEKDKDAYALILDRTAFFPEEGGQCCDRGTIDGCEVLHVSIKNGVITHTVDTPFVPGSTVHGELDLKLRFDNEQQHSGEHILSGLAHSLYGCTNVGFRLAPDYTTLDFDRPLSAEQLLDLEKRANEVVYRDLPVKCSFPSAEELAVLDYRSKIELSGDVRIVEIPGVDICACCAPHVDSTGLIGMIKIIKHEAWKGGVRLTILCGKRALMYFGKALSTLDSLTKLCSAGPDALPEAVNALLQKSLKAEADKNKAETLLLEHLLKSGIEKLQKEPASADEDRDKAPLILFTSAMDTRNIRNAINSVASGHAGILAVFAEQDGSMNFIASSTSGGLKAITDTLRKELGAKCGGNDTMIQGTVSASKEDILRCFGA